MPPYSSQVPPYSGTAELPADGSKVQNSWNLAEASRNVVEILSNEKPRDTWRSGEFRFYFTPVVPDEFILLIWIYRIFNWQCRVSGYKECAGVNR
jgi:hypothetical protein